MKQGVCIGKKINLLVGKSQLYGQVDGGHQQRVLNNGKQDILYMQVMLENAYVEHAKSLLVRMVMTELTASPCVDAKEGNRLQYYHTRMDSLCNRNRKIVNLLKLIAGA